MLVDLTSLIAEASGVPISEIETPEDILRRIEAEDVQSWEGSPAYELLLLDNKEMVAYVQSAGRGQEAVWYPIEGVKRSQFNATRARLERAASLYLGVPKGATDLILAGLADGAGNGLGACLLYRTVAGGAGDDDEDDETLETDESVEEADHA